MTYTGFFYDRILDALQDVMRGAEVAAALGDSVGSVVADRMARQHGFPDYGTMILRMGAQREMDKTLVAGISQSRLFEIGAAQAAALSRRKPPTFPLLPFESMFIAFDEPITLTNRSPLRVHDSLRYGTLVYSESSGVVTLDEDRPKKDAPYTIQPPGDVRFGGIFLWRVGRMLDTAQKIGTRLTDKADRNAVRFWWWHPIRHADGVAQLDFYTAVMDEKKWPVVTLNDPGLGEGDLAWAETLTNLTASILHFFNAPGVVRERVDVPDKLNKRRARVGRRLLRPYHRLVIPRSTLQPGAEKWRTGSKHSIRYDVVAHLKFFAYCPGCDAVNRKTGDACRSCGASIASDGWKIKPRLCPAHQRGLVNEIYLPALRVARETGQERGIR
jgi:hypothetical protein